MKGYIMLWYVWMVHVPNQDQALGIQTWLLEQAFASDNAYNYIFCSTFLLCFRKWKQPHRNGQIGIAARFAHDTITNAMKHAKPLYLGTIQPYA